MASNLLSALLSQIGQGATGVANTLSSLMQPQQPQANMWRKPSNETIRIDENGNKIRDFGKIDFGNLSGQAPAPSMSPTPMPTPTPMPSPMLSQPAPATNDKFRFAYEMIPRDQYWADNGPRPGFEPQQPPKAIADLIRKVFPEEATKAALLASTENAQFDPGRADNVNDGGKGSRDRGIFQINEDTFNGLMKRRGNELKQMGVKSYQDMYDAEKNTLVAKMVLEEGGFGRWYGWQDTGYNMNGNRYSKEDRGLYEEAKLKKKNKK